MADTFTSEQLEELLELQDVDARIRRIDHELAHLEEQQRLDEATEERDRLGRQQDDLRVDLDQRNREYNKLDGETELLQQRLDAERARLYGGEITNAREMKSLEAEIESTERRISEHEDRELEIMMETDELEGQIQSLEDRRDQLGSRIEELTSARDRAAEALLAEQAELKVDRDRHRSDLPGALLDRYDEVSERSPGKAVGQMADGLCTACGIQLPVAEANELYEGPPLATCPCPSKKLLIIQ